MFDTNKIGHSHYCECHVIRNDTLEDQDGKIWTEEEIQTHLNELEVIE